MGVVFYQSAQMDVYQTGMLSYQEEIKTTVSMCFKFGDVVRYFRTARTWAEYALAFVNNDNRARRCPLRPCLNAFSFWYFFMWYFQVKNAVYIKRTIHKVFLLGKHGNDFQGFARTRYAC